MSSDGNPYGTSRDSESSERGVPLYRLVIGLVARGLAVVFFFSFFLFLGMGYLIRATSSTVRGLLDCWRLRRSRMMSPASA
ncbi:MAG: hypothetical protein RL215_1549 [Planctomycetota bacterium]